jgi:hypothetical protein
VWPFAWGRVTADSCETAFAAERMLAEALSPLTVADAAVDEVALGITRVAVVPAVLARAEAGAEVLRFNCCLLPCARAFAARCACARPRLVRVWAGVTALVLRPVTCPRVERERALGCAVTGDGVTEACARQLLEAGYSSWWGAVCVRPPAAAASVPRATIERALLDPLVLELRPWAVSASRRKGNENKKYRKVQGNNSRKEKKKG